MYRRPCLRMSAWRRWAVGAVLLARAMQAESPRHAGAQHVWESSCSDPDVSAAACDRERPEAAQRLHPPRWGPAPAAVPGAACGCQQGASMTCTSPWQTQRASCSTAAVRSTNGVGGKRHNVSVDVQAAPHRDKREEVRQGEQTQRENELRRCQVWQ